MTTSRSAGDHALTGLAIGRMLGIAGNGSVFTGPELDAMSDEQLCEVRRAGAIGAMGAGA